MEMYRLTQKQFAQSPFDPIGARLFGGRWNSKGVEALYFAESESLCVLEVFVHINNDPTLTERYDLYRIEIPDQWIAQLCEDDWPENWRALPAAKQTQEIGDQFLTLQSPEYAALQVPSAISPRDSNYLVNLHHPLMPEIFQNAEKLEFSFDPRIFK